MLCGCGCGGDGGRYTKTTGEYVKGQERPFVQGHWNRGATFTLVEPPNPSGLCECGCGGTTALATQTLAKHGHAAGEHMRFIRGHRGKLRRRKTITPDLWRVEDRGYETPCWVFVQAPATKSGYCKVQLRGKSVSAHRAMYEQEVGPIPEGLTIDHLCFVTNCINPTHLEPVTIEVNRQRATGTKLTPEIVRAIRAHPGPIVAISRRFGVESSHVSSIRSRRLWKNVA